MQPKNFTITIHMASSLDGMIAKKDNSISWFETSDHYEKGIEDVNISEFLKSIDCYIMGARTYEMGLALSTEYGWPYGNTPTFVLSHRELKKLNPHIQFYSGSLSELVNEKLRPHYKNVWLAGGPNLVKEFMQQKLADEIRMMILPIILGDGLPFFEATGREQELHLKNTTAYKNGMVELWYEIKK